jgi:hypothetical protein
MTIAHAFQDWASCSGSVQVLAGTIVCRLLNSRVDIERWAFPFTPKKIPPPTPEGREGRLFPPEQSSKTGELVTEVLLHGNKILHELSDEHYVCRKLPW